MGKIIFISGGARSGKSTFAIQEAKKHKGKIAFIATCEPKDREMKKRIALHKISRPKNWTIFEEPIDIEPCIKSCSSGFKTIIVDCLTLWITNLIMNRMPSRLIEERIKKLINAIDKIKADCIIVTNEVGLGIVPGNKLARDFRDIAGRINQIVAQKSKTVYFMVSGIPWRIK